MDVVEAGPPERPRRGLAVGAAAVLLLGAGVYAATRPPERAARPAPPPSSSSRSAAAPSVPPLETFGPDPEWTLPPLRERTRIAYAMTGPTLRVLDVDTGDAVELTGPRPEPLDPVARVGDAWLVLERAPCGQEQCTYARLVRGRRVTEIGLAETVVPDGRGAVWLSGAGEHAGYRSPRFLDRRTYDGAHSGPQTMLRPEERLLGVTPLGPLVGDPGAVGPDVYVVDPATRRRRVVLRQAHVVGVAGPVVAWTTTGCQEEPRTECSLAVTDLVRRSETTFEDLPGLPTRAALSPSGRFVALAFDRAGPPTPLTVYDVRRAEPLTVDGLTDPPVEALAWSPDSRWLVAAGPVSARRLERQMAVWRPGLRRAYAGPPLPPARGSALVVVAAR